MNAVDDAITNTVNACSGIQEQDQQASTSSASSSYTGSISSKIGRFFMKK
jgi:hypothetical protein